MDRKQQPATPKRPAGLQTITPDLYAQIRQAIRALSAPAATAR